MIAEKTRKFDALLFICALFNAVNIIVFLHSLMNYSLITIATVFIIGFTNILLASLMAFRIKKSEYQNIHTPTTLKLAQTYVNTVFRGGLFIALSYVAVALIIWLSIGMPWIDYHTPIHHCSAAISPAVNSDFIGFVQYSFDNLMCNTGNSRFFSFISIDEDNFVIVVMNRLMNANLGWGRLWPISLYILLIVSVIPFIWMFTKFTHIIFELFRKDKVQA